MTVASENEADVRVGTNAKLVFSFLVDIDLYPNDLIILTPAQY